MGPLGAYAFRFGVLRLGVGDWWIRLDLNQRPRDYESPALTGLSYGSKEACPVVCAAGSDGTFGECGVVRRGHGAGRKGV